MNGKVYFSDEDRRKARTTDIAEFLRQNGECVRRCGSEYVWLDGSQKVTVRNNVWFSHYEQKGGDAIDFVRKYFDKNYYEAVRMLLGDNFAVRKEREEKPFILPKPNDSMNRMYAYLLMTRGIDRQVLDTFVRNKLIYESADYHNAVFIGYDKDGTPRHAHKRGTVKNNAFKGNVSGSQPQYSFHWNGNSRHIFLFEAPIDLLSFISLHKENWQRHTYASACSVSDRVLFQCLKDNPKLNNVYLCLDNDEAGQTADRRIQEKLSEMNISSKILVPNLKDWNEDLLCERNGETVCQELHY